MQQRGTRRAGESGKAEVQVAAHPGESLADVKVADGSGSSVELPTLPLEQPSFSSYKPVPEVVKALLTPSDCFLNACKGSVPGEFSQPLPPHKQLVTHRSSQAPAKPFFLLFDLLLRADDEFGSSRRCGRTQVGHKVQDSEVGFVADR